MILHFFFFRNKSSGVVRVSSQNKPHGSVNWVYLMFSKRYLSLLEHFSPGLKSFASKGVCSTGMIIQQTWRDDVRKAHQVPLLLLFRSTQYQLESQIRENVCGTHGTERTTRMSLLLPYECGESKTSHKAWWQMPLPSHLTSKTYF